MTQKLKIKTALFATLAAFAFTVSAANIFASDAELRKNFYVTETHVPADSSNTN